MDRFDQTSFNLIHPLYREIVGDETVRVLMHELFHVVDLHLYLLSPADQSKSNRRQEFFNSAWNTDGSSKVTGFDEIAPVGGRVEDSIRSDLLRHQFILEKTNFISAAGAESPIEDFATILESHFMLKTYGQGSATFEFFQNAGDIRPSHSFSDKARWNSSPSFRSRGCFLVKLVLGDPCS